MKILCASILAAMLSLAGFAEVPFGVRAVQLDLARQMETVAFIKGFFKFAKDSGYNTIVLYLEGRVKTKSFPFRTDTDTYTPDQMREVVAEAASLGIDIVPVVSVLAHAENFVGCKEMQHLSEERETPGRFGGCGKMTFCHSLPETRAFLEGYLKEMFEIFPGKNFHVGLDESFNTGFCPICAPKMEGDGLGIIYMDVIDWAHGFLARNGKRMWMWDDFFEFFPERVKNVPKNVVMCNWEYSPDVSAERGPHGHFGERYRRDWVREYAERGVDSMVCPWSNVVNIERMSAYGEKAGASGALLTQWEMSAMFHSAALPVVRAVGRWWSSDIRMKSFDATLDIALAEIFPMLTDEERIAVKVLLYDCRRLRTSSDVLSYLGFKERPERRTAEELAVKTLKASSLKPLSGDVPADPFSPAAILDDIVAQAEQKNHWDFFASIAPKLVSVRRMPEDVAAAKEEVRKREEGIAALCERRCAQEAAWRLDCSPNGACAPFDALIAMSKNVLAMDETSAEDDEWQLEFEFVLPDFHGRPVWSVYAQVDDKWVELIKEKIWKPNPGENAYFERIVPLSVRLKTAPKALKVVCEGYGEAGLAHVALANRFVRFVPTGLASATGLVRSAENILEDTVSAAWFGDARTREQMLHPFRGKVESAITLSIGKGN